MHRVCILCAMAYRAAVVGGSGYTGAELLRLLAGHPEIEVVHVTADTNAGAAVGSLYPSLDPGVRRPPVLALRRRRPERTRPRLHRAPARRVAVARPGDPRTGRARRRSRRRLPAAGRRVPTLVRRTARRARADRSLRVRDGRAVPQGPRRAREHVAVPGCYPTAVSLALAPCAAERLVEPRGIVANAVSGVSGAGRALKTTSLFSESNENVSAYGLLTHRHTAEMEQALSHVARADRSRCCSRRTWCRRRAGSSRPVTRGRRSAASRRRACSSSTASSTRTIRASSSSTTRRAPRRPTARNVVHVTVRFDARTDTVLAIAAEDNLTKGASGQAIQAANIVLGLPETTGLPLLG